MTRKAQLIASIALLCSACSTPPKPPTVDESTKRPVNAADTVGLQMCRSELTAAKIVLTETLDQQRVLSASAPKPAPAATVEAIATKPNQIFIIQFALGSAELRVPAAQQAPLLAQAQTAKFIVIRGRTDAMTDSLSETRLAQRRAEAAYHYLVRSVRLPADGVRLSWQGAGGQAQVGASVDARQANRRVEIELYQARPAIQVLNTQS
jgi:outer membrane protein OmpA-like peptidoglycan-associated protein